MERDPQPPYERVILVCVNERGPEEGPSCAPRGSVDIARAFKERVKERGAKARVRVSRTLCLGRCRIGPNVAILPDNVWYHAVTLADVDAILEQLSLA
jgi:sirohydrochlorin cobaltochelatase